jgi:hypothetical protein
MDGRGILGKSLELKDVTVLEQDGQVQVEGPDQSVR